MIPLTECKNRKLYRIRARNFSLGVFNEVDKGFIGMRFKFGNTYAFTEYHWDTGTPFGTVQPFEELPEELPEGIELNDSGPTICHNCRVKAKFLTNDDSIKGKWIHLEETNCQDVHAVGTSNEPLESWLVEMKKKYSI